MLRLTCYTKKYANLSVRLAVPSFLTCWLKKQVLAVNNLLRCKQTEGDTAKIQHDSSKQKHNVEKCCTAGLLSVNGVMLPRLWKFSVQFQCSGDEMEA